MALLPSFQVNLIVKSDSRNSIYWVKNGNMKPRKLHFCFNKNKALVFLIQVEYCHMVRSANGLADSLAKQGVD